MSDAPVVSLEKVSYYYPRSAAPVLCDVDLVLRPGEIVGVIGASGAGKTTLCLALNGIVPQFHGGRFFGSVRVAGRDTVEHPIHELSRHVGMVFQDPATQLVAASVEAEVAFALENLGVPADEIRRRVAQSLAAVRLDDAAHKHPHELSGGQQQRLALAAALALRPGLIVLDEPTSQLDPRSAVEVFHLIRAINRESGTTFLVAGHAAEEMAECVQRVVLLAHGRVVADDRVETVYRDTELLARERVRPPEVAATFALLAARGLFGGAVPVRLQEGLRELAGLSAAPASFPDSAPAAAAKTGGPILSLREVTWVYPDGTRALQDVSLDIVRGDYVLIAGENGAGKSTLLRHLLNLLRPTAGAVLIDGTPLGSYSVAELAQRVGYVPQNPDRQLFNATVRAEVGFSLQVLPLPPEEKARRVTEALAELDLTAHADTHPFALSKGDRARVVIAAVLVMNPEILIFDEPTTGQDEAGARAILELTRRLHASGRTIIVVTHHLYLMPGYARRAVVLGGGRVVFDAPLRRAFHAVDVLEKSNLRGTQAVLLARAAHPDNHALTPAELAASFPEPVAAGGTGVAPSP